MLSKCCHMWLYLNFIPQHDGLWPTDVGLGPKGQAQPVRFTIMFGKMLNFLQLLRKFNKNERHKIFNFLQKCVIFTQNRGNAIFHFSQKSYIFSRSIRSIGQKWRKIGHFRPFLGHFRPFSVKNDSFPADPVDLAADPGPSSDLRPLFEWIWEIWVACILRFYSIARTAAIFIIGA